MSQSAELQVPWWKKSNRDTLGDRIKAVQNVNDPTIVADDVQRWSTRFLWLLLAFTTLLSGFSYYKFFELSFGPMAIVMALALAITIEFGKNWGFLKVLRMPFFLGWKHIQSEVQETIMWVGLLLLAITTFCASVYNSTHGARQLSLLLSNERNVSQFTPNTAEIDAQIAATQSSMAENRAIKWKGTVTYQAQKAIQKESGALDKLQSQRVATIDQQRKDWEAQQAIKNGQNTFSANSLLAVGGFVELLQVLLMFMRVAAERSLDKVATDRSYADLKTRTNGFQNLTPNGNGQSRSSTSAYPQNHAIGFVWDGYGTTPINPKPPVSQPPPPVSQPTQQSATVLGCDKILMALRTKLQADIPNIIDKNGILTTIHKRIVKAFNECYDAMQHDDFVPSRNVAIKVYQYLSDEAIPALNRVGWPYENDAFFLKRLSDVIEQRTPQEA